MQVLAKDWLSARRTGAASPGGNCRGARSQMAEGSGCEADDLRSCGLAGNDGFVGNGLVGVAGKQDVQKVGIEARPTVVGFPLEEESEPEVAARSLLPRTP